MSHDSGFRRKSHDRSMVHRQRKRRDHASRFFEQKTNRRRQLRSRLEQEAAERPEVPAEEDRDETG